MKKLLFCSFFVTITLSVIAQEHYVTDGLPRTNPVLYHNERTPQDNQTVNSRYIPGEKRSDMLTIGNTFYDSQTYNSGNLMNRLYQFSDGTIGATWMHKGLGGNPDRGTAYAYYNGTSWSAMDPHLGSDPNNGFPSYAPWGPNGEVIAHYRYIANDGPIRILRRENKGTGEWVERTLLPPEGNHSIVWHSMCTSGLNHEYIHVLALVYDDPYMGQDDALLYYRSSDGGDTWDINGVVIEGTGSDYFTSVPSLHYSWAQPVGNTIAFTFGFSEFDGLVFKSNDNGETWQKYTVYQSPYTPFNVPLETPTYGCCDGTSAIALDSDGKAHVVFGRMLRFRDMVNGTGWYYYPTASEGLIYWNESMPPLDSTTVSSYTLDYLEAGGNLVGYIVPENATVNIISGQPDYGVALTSQPQLGIDADNNLFLAYAAIAPEYSLDDIYYRHIYCNASFNGGATWSGPKDINDDDYFMFSECVFPALAPVIDDKLHIIFQEDYAPGTGAGAGLDEENYIDYMFFDKVTFVGVKENPPAEKFSVSQNYPNPADGITHIMIKLNEPSFVNVTISNLLGQELQSLNKRNLSEGKHLINFDLSGLEPGIYLYTVKANSGSITRRMVIK
jgi:hypothetical protein